MPWLLSIFSPAQWLGGGIALAVLLAAGWGVHSYGSSRYDAGVRETTTTFLEADERGATDVRKTAIEALRNAGLTDNPDELLLSTGGLRD